MTEDMGPFPHQNLASDGTLEQKQQEQILETLDDYPDGIGFNELLREVNDIISRNTLKSRLEKYEEESIVETPDDWRRGQKKKYRLTEKGRVPNNLEKQFEDGCKYIWEIWGRILDMYGEDTFSRGKVIQYVLNERVRYGLVTSVSADATNQDYSPDIEIDSQQLPNPNKDDSIAEFYNTIAAELYKFYTETIFGKIYIETESKSSLLKKEIMLKTYDSTVDLRIQMNEMWNESEVPTLESDSKS
ncbi:winged helix-turn-helix domain-containing protein [Halohasta litorea]|uniref:Winged helix-turn-helix domain-containing protein n=1 Tax=Halohasta litorea TaxID=869891 RepID=A0ABD6D7P1_9EURY|nr:winged helix-turn-helix domain-containing protein [Halohasta litorea]